MASAPSRSSASERARTSGGIGGMSRKAFGQRVEVEAGAADDDRAQAGAPRVRQRGGGIAQPGADRIARVAGTWP